MKIVSKRGRTKVLRSPAIPGLDVIEYEYIITDSSGTMSADQIKAAEKVFKDLRKQLEDFGKIMQP